MPGFGIPDACGGGGDGADYTIESVRHHRFSMSVEGLPSMPFIYSIDQPSYELELVTFHQGQDEIHRPGKTKYQPLSVVFYDVLDGETCWSERSFSWWKRAIDTSQSELRSKFKKNAQVMLETGDGGKVWEYTLLGSWPVQVQMDRLSQDDTEIARVTVVLRFDKLR